MLKYLTTKDRCTAPTKNDRTKFPVHIPIYEYANNFELSDFK